MRRGKSPQNINEELNKMKRLMSFSINENSHDSLAEENFNKSTEVKNILLEKGLNKIESQRLNESVDFFGEDKYFLMIFKKNGKPKLIEIGTLKVETGKFLPTKEGNKLFNTTGDVLLFSQLKENEKFKKLRSVRVDEFGNSERIVSDVELDDYVESIIEDNLNYKEELKNRESISKGSNWNGNTTGSIILDIGDSQTYANAYNIPNPNTEFPEARRLNLLEAITKPGSTKLSPNPDPQEFVDITFDDVDINKTVKTYCDNMIKPNMSDPDVVREMDIIIERLKKYISAPPDVEGKTALSKLTNITILGQADAAAPGWLPGPPCTGGLDHDYGGIEKLPRKERSVQMKHDMNKFLATNRATEYKKVFLQRVKEKLGVDLVIKELPSIEYYGKGEQYRGEQYRSIQLRFNAPLHRYNNINRQDSTPIKILIDDLESAGYSVELANINTPSGVKKFTVLRKGEEVYVSENNIFMKKDSPDRGTINMLHKYSYGVKASLEGYNLVIKTSAGDVTLEGEKGNRGNAMIAGSQKSFFQTWYPFCDYEFLEVAGICFPKPNKDAFYAYKPEDVINVKNETYYRLYGFTYSLIPMGCTNKTSSPPSKKKIIMDMLSSEPRYSDKQLRYLGKKVQKAIGKDLKNLEQLRRKEEIKLYDIQMDINDRKRRD